MADLKPGWKRWRFEQIALNVNERVDDPAKAGVEYYVGLEHLDSGNLKISRWGSPNEVSATKLLFQPGDIIFGRRRAYQRKLGVADFRGIASAHSLVLRAKPPIILPSFLPFFLQSNIFMERAQKISVGSLSPTINWKSLAKEKFIIPCENQQREITQVLRKSLKVASLSEGALQKATLLYLSSINFFVNRWAEHLDSWIPLRDVLENAPESGFSAPESSDETGQYVLTLSALSRGGYVPGHFKNIPISAEAASVHLENGDLLISRSNTPERVGFVGIFGETGSLAISFPDTIMRLRTRPDKLSPEVLEMILQSNRLRRQIMSIAAGTSTSMKKINKRNLLNVRIPVPSLESQKSAIRTRQEFKASVQAAQKQSANAWKLHFAIMNELIGVGNAV